MTGDWGLGIGDWSLLTCHFPPATCHPFARFRYASQTRLLNQRSLVTCHLPPVRSVSIRLADSATQPALTCHLPPATLWRL
ncbi:MAG: hypothetical protein DWI57_17685 [Chloroflexi bacterium]|nr:MAG: hypothetical protein DWI57_17685 [Chloroflexota bacterium]